MYLSEFCGGDSKYFFSELNAPNFKRIPSTVGVLGLKALSWKGIQQKPVNVHLYMSVSKFKYAEIYAMSNFGSRQNNCLCFHGYQYNISLNMLKIMPPPINQ